MTVPQITFDLSNALLQRIQSNREENSNMRIKMIIAIIAATIVGCLVKKIFGDICGFVAGLWVAAILKRWVNS